MELPGGSYSALQIQDYIEYIIKRHETVSDNPSIKINVNKIETRITFKIKTGYYLERATLETMKLLGSTKSKIIKDENDENLPHLKITEVVLVHCNIINSYSHHHSVVLYTFRFVLLFSHTSSQLLGGALCFKLIYLYRYLL